MSRHHKGAVTPPEMVGFTSSKDQNVTIQGSFKYACCASHCRFFSLKTVMMFGPIDCFHIDFTTNSWFVQDHCFSLFNYYFLTMR